MRISLCAVSIFLVVLMGLPVLAQMNPNAFTKSRVDVIVDDRKIATVSCFRRGNDRSGSLEIYVDLQQLAHSIGKAVTFDKNGPSGPGMICEGKPVAMWGGGIPAYIDDSGTMYVSALSVGGLFAAQGTGVHDDGVTFTTHASDAMMPMIFTTLRTRDQRGLVNLLERYPTQVNARYLAYHNATPLHMAIKWPSGLKILLRYKPDLNAQYQDGRTPLHEAVFDDEVESIKLLLEAGANPNVKDLEGKTPLDYAAQLHKSPVVDLLKQHGATGSSL